MILSSRVIFPLVHLPSTTARRKFVAAVASGDRHVGTDQLRTQLDQLITEAETTRSKANIARLRFMRLSEAAENLQQRAVTDIINGKESKAREMLIEKKKLMQALEKSKNRIELLDSLSAKISEAISVKETQLLGNISMNPEIYREGSCDQIHFVHPKDLDDEDSNRIDTLNTDFMTSCEDQDLTAQTSEANLSSEDEQTNLEEATIVVSSDGDDDGDGDVVINSLKGISSYEEFLKAMDEQLEKVERELSEFLRLSAMVLESDQIQMNPKVLQTSEILEGLRNIRGRIAGFIRAN